MKRPAKMLADRLKEPVTLQRPKTAIAGEDDFGTIDLTLDANWITAGSRRAEIKSQAGREFDTARQVRSDHTHKVTVRYDSLTRTIEPTWRIRFTDAGGQYRTFQVLDAVDLDEQHVEILLLVKEAR